MPKSETKKSTRRHGEELENAVLEVVWELVNEVGYRNLTISGVAKLAGTNKPTIYRHWATKSALVAAAYVKFGPKPDIKVPDTGVLRTDLISIFQQIGAILEGFTSGKLAGILVDRLQEVNVPKIFLEMQKEKEQQSGGEQAFAKLFLPVLKAAEKRGELRVVAVPKRVQQLPLLLILNELLSQQALTNEATEEIVDQVLLPLLTVGH